MQHQGTCLVVEDSSFDQERMRRVLAKGFPGLNVVAVATLEEAQAVLDTVQVRLILLDNNLPDGQGANFAVALSADAELHKIPIIMVSDWPSPFMFHKAEMAGVLHVVSKSDFGARYIHAALQKTTRKRRTQTLG